MKVIGGPLDGKEGDVTAHTPDGRKFVLPNGLVYEFVLDDQGRVVDERLSACGPLDPSIPGKLARYQSKDGDLHYIATAEGGDVAST